MGREVVFLGGIRGIVNRNMRTVCVYWDKGLGIPSSVYTTERFEQMLEEGKITKGGIK